MDASALVYSLSLPAVKGTPSSRTDRVDAQNYAARRSAAASSAPNLHGKSEKNAGLAHRWDGVRGPNGEGIVFPPHAAGRRIGSCRLALAPTHSAQSYSLRSGTYGDRCATARLTVSRKWETLNGLGI